MAEVTRAGRPCAVLSSGWWTAGLNSAERQTLDGPPEWAVFAELAVTTANPDDRLTDLPAGPATGASDLFAAALWPWVSTAGEQLDSVLRARATDALIEVATMRPAWVTWLGRRLVGLAARTMVHRLEVARHCGTLTGATPRERFNDFLGRQGTRAELARTVTEYPGLARLLGEYCVRAVHTTAEFIERLAEDRTDIVRDLLHGVDPGQLVAVEFGAGDSHGGGRSVGQCHFADGRSVMYKPRPLDLYVHFGLLVDWLNRLAPTLCLRTTRVVRRPEHGWAEFVTHEQCRDQAEVDRFYHRQGALLALLHAVDGTDFHCENLIASGDQPVLVDIETLFHPVLPHPLSTGADPAAEALASSVDAVGLLPRVLLGDHGEADLSGLGGGAGGVHPVDGLAWEAEYTDRMRLVRRPSVLDQQPNRPRMAGRDADPTEYLIALLAGFRLAYRVIVAHRDDLISADGPLRRCADDEIRVIVRPTQLYAVLFGESTHPDALRDSLDRDRLFDLLHQDSVDDPIRSRLAPDEIVDLWHGDIPLFTGRPATRDLWTADGRRIPDVFTRSPLDSVIAKTATFGAADLREQEWLITATLATRAPAATHRSGRSATQLTAAVTTPDRRRLLAAACGIADELAARARQGHGRANWIGLELVDDRRWSVAPLGAALTDGYCGVALFLAQLALLTDRRDYQMLATEAIQPIPRLLATLAADAVLVGMVGWGMQGLGGICYALARLSTLTSDDTVAAWLSDAVRLAENEGEFHVDLTPGTDLSVATGLAGGLAALLAVHRETGLPAASRSAEIFADRLAAAAAHGATVHTMGNGFARGRAGVGWALLRHTGHEYATVGREVLASDPDQAAWSGPADTSDLGWCAGLAGTVLAHMDHLDELDDRVVDNGLRVLARHRPLADLSLCHGELGLAEPLAVLAARGDRMARIALGRRTGAALDVLDHTDAPCGTPGGMPSPGLLTGLSGIGYGLLRLAFPEDVPSVLMLESSGSP